MNWDQIEGNWMQFRGKVREHWGRLTDDDLDVIAGRRDQLIGRIQQAYGVMKEEAENQVKSFETKVNGFLGNSRDSSRPATASR